MKKPSTDKDKTEVKEEKKDKKKSKETKPRKRKEEEPEDDGEIWKVVTKGTASSSEKPIMFAKDAEIDTPIVISKLNEVMSARGKKRTDRKMQIEFLHELKAVADSKNLGSAVAAKINFNIISAIFDYNPKVSEPMKIEFWGKLVDITQNLLKLLLSPSEIYLSESVLEDMEEYETEPFRIRGCILTAVERLDDEFTKLLKECDPHSNEYVER